jgi:hypothetical protein
MKNNIKYLKRIKLINTLGAMDFVIVDQFLLLLFSFWGALFGGVFWFLRGGPSYLGGFSASGTF